MSIRPQRPEFMMYNQPCWSPDGNFLACIYHKLNTHEDSYILIKRMKPLDKHYKLNQDLIGTDVLHIKTKTIPFYLYWSSDSTHLSWLSSCPQGEDSAYGICFWMFKVYDTLLQYAQSNSDSSQSMETVFHFYDVLHPKTVVVKQSEKQVDGGAPFYYSFRPLPTIQRIEYESSHVNFWDQQHSTHFYQIALHKKHQNQVQCIDYRLFSKETSYSAPSPMQSYFENPILLPNDLLAFFEPKSRSESSCIFKVKNTQSNKIIFEYDLGEQDMATVVSNAEGNILVFAAFSRDTGVANELYMINLKNSPQQMFKLEIAANYFFVVKDTVVAMQPEPCCIYSWSESMQQNSNNTSVVAIPKSQMSLLGKRTPMNFLERNYYQFFSQYHLSHYYGSHDGKFFVTGTHYGNGLMILVDLEQKINYFKFIEGKFAIFHPPVQKL